MAFDPIKQLKSIQDKINRNIETTFGDYQKPYSYISQNSKGVNIEITLPNIKEENVFLFLNEKRIEIKAEKRGVKTDNEVKIKSFVGFYRKINLPKGLSVNKAEVKFKDNKLKIYIPKKKKN